MKRPLRIQYPDAGSSKVNGRPDPFILYETSVSIKKNSDLILYSFGKKSPLGGLTFSYFMAYTLSNHSALCNWKK